MTDDPPVWVAVSPMAEKSAGSASDGQKSAGSASDGWQNNQWGSTTAWVARTYGKRMGRALPPTESNSA